MTMIGTITPAQAGLDPSRLQMFMQHMAQNGINLHSVLMLRGNDIFFEKYWAPFTATTPHRMYSVTKSFVAIAIGCLLDEGKLSLDDPICRYFPDKLPDDLSPEMERQTIRDMLTMRTCFAGCPENHWFQPGVTDRTAFYFSRKPAKPAGTLFDYDSTGSYILGVLVERLSGMSLLDYLRSKVLDRIGGFKSAQMLATPDGTPWGDSALLCTPRALMNFARFVMNTGTWEGERLLSENYLREATACQTDNNLTDGRNYNQQGYGYQIWRTWNNSFSFNGMGGQFAICVPDSDFIFVCTCDHQLNSERDNPVIFRAVFNLIVPYLDGRTPPAPEFDLNAPLELSVARGNAHSDFSQSINGVVFALEPNPMGIDWLRLDFTDSTGTLTYGNAQGKKKLPFGMKKNHFGKFPQLGYSNNRGNVHDITDFRYDCAVSAGWIEPQKLQIRVQIVDRYFGILIITLGFADENLVGIRMAKCAEDFLNEYDGWAIAHRV